MAGNKHKNGIVCMFPGCEKKMRTQKFKGHFMKTHLREGEEYTVEHRRQFEVAQTEPMYETTSATGSPVDLMGATKMKAEAPKRVSPLETAKKAADAMLTGIQTPLYAPEPPRAPTTDVLEQQAPTPLPPAPIAIATPIRAKRSASAISTDAGAPAVAAETAVVDESNAMVTMMLHLDRRVNELHAKMDDIIEMQRLFFAAAMPRDSNADEQAAKKRKETSMV